MAIKQLSIFLENKPGMLVSVTTALGEAGIDIRAMSIADTQDFGILRLIVSDAERGKQVLSSIGVLLKVTQVVAVKVSDEPGALTAVTSLLSQNNINIEYMYAFLTGGDSTAYVVLRVGDNEAASTLLTENGIALVTEDDIAKL